MTSALMISPAFGGLQVLQVHFLEHYLLNKLLEFAAELQELQLCNHQLLFFNQDRGRGVLDTQSRNHLSLTG